MAAHWAAVLILLTLTLQFSSPLKTESDSILSVLTSLNKLVTFVESNTKNINLDGLFGLRVVEGQLLLIKASEATGSLGHLSTATIKQLSDLHIKTKAISDSALEPVKRDDAQYFQDFTSLITTPWTISKPHRKLDPSLRWEIPQYKAKMKVSLDEKTSDECMTQLFKSTNSTCLVSDYCVRFMTTRGLTGYSITHQLLWSMLAERVPSCTSQLTSSLQARGLLSLHQMQLELCTNVFYEMVAVVQVLMGGRVMGDHQDLFLEQQFICPNIGFYEFLKMDYLHQMLDWQFPSGCFGEDEDYQDEDEHTDDVASLLETYHKEGEQLSHVKTSKGQKKMAVENLQQNINPKGKSIKFKSNVGSKSGIPSSRNKIKNKAKETQKTGRKLLFEKDMGDGCLAHKSAVAAGALVMYLRYLIDPGPDLQWEGPHQLFEEDHRKILDMQALQDQANSDNNHEEDDDDEGDDETVNNNNQDGEDGEYDDEDGDEDEEGDEYSQEDYDDGIVDDLVKGEGLGVGGDSKPGADKDSVRLQNKDLSLGENNIVDVVEKQKDQEQEEEHNYYDDEKDAERLGKEVMTHDKRGKGVNTLNPVQSSFYGKWEDDLTAVPAHPKYYVIVIVSLAPFVIMFFFCLKFIRKRRVHIRYYN